MKTKELIRQLQEVDPEGDAECMVDGVDIHFVEGLPGYYDGCYQILIRDPKLPYYNVMAVKITKKGMKVRLHIHSARDAILDDPKMPVIIDLEHDKELWENRVQAWRDEAIAIEKEVNEWSEDRKNPGAK